MATTGISERAAVAKAPPRNLPICRTSSKVPSGKNTRDWPVAASFSTRRASTAALVTVEALDELRAQAAQQQAGQRHVHHFLLDHEGKIGWQRRGGDQSVDVARMVGDHHAGGGRQPLRPSTVKGMPAARRNPRDTPPATRRRRAQPGQEQIDHQHAQTQAGKQHQAVGGIQPLQAAAQAYPLVFCDLVLLMLILNCTVILVTPTCRHASHTGSR